MREEFIDLCPDGSRVIADSGFTGKTEREKRLFAVANSFDTPAVKELKQRARAREETINKRLKDYKCFVLPFKDGIDKHCLCFHAGLTLIQYAIEDTCPESGEPLITI